MSFTEFHFIRPTWLLAIFPYLVIIVFLLRNKLSRGNWSTVCDAELLPYLLQEKSGHNSRWALSSGGIAAFLVIFALAGPSWQRVPSPIFRNESALVIALDLSRSMDAEDIKPSRLIRARYKVADILKRRKDGQTALLVYSGAAFTVTPLTDDTETIASQLTALTTDIMPSEGNDAELVLKKAVDLFKQAGLQKGQILLVTDDVDKTKEAVAALENYSLSVLGVGTLEGAPIAVPAGGFLKDERGSIVIPKLNAADLAKLAQQGGGVYQSISADDSDILALLSALDQPVKQQGKENKNLLLDQWDDKGPWLLLLVLPLAALNFRKGLLTIALVLLMPLPKNSYAVEWQDLWKNKDQQAQQAYKNKEFDKAASLFENPAWKAAAHYKAGAYDKALESLVPKPEENNANILYNQANALAKSGQLEPAIKAYEKALVLNPDDSDAKYNKELVEKALDKQKQEQKKQEQKKQDQQKKDDKQDKQDKSDKDDQQKKDGEPSEQSEQQKASEQKPEQSEEKKSQQQQADEPGTPDNKEPEKQPEADKAEQAAEPKKTDAKQQTKPATEVAQPTTEQQQANEQWLNRIPDDPAGLLKRKFKYQYGQQRGQ